MRQTETCLEMCGLQTQESLIVDTRQIIVMLLDMDVGTEIERSQILIISMENLAVFREGVVPLLEIDIGLGLEQVRARLFYFGNCVQTYGRILPPDEVVAGIAAVTADDVLAIANEILDDATKSVSWVTPKG